MEPNPSQRDPDCRAPGRGRGLGRGGVSAAVDMMHDSAESGVVAGVPALRP